MSYLDDGKGRAGFAPLDRCYRSRVCALFREHGGGCDPRSEAVRAAYVSEVSREIAECDAHPDTLAILVEAEARVALAFAEALFALCPRGRPTPPRYRVVTGRPGVLDHVEHLTPRGEPCGPIGPERTMNRAGEYAPGIVVCCAACGDGVPDVPPSVVAIVEAAERRWETEQTKGEEQARALDRLIAAGVDVTQLPPPKAKRRGRRRQQALSFAAPPSGPYSVPGREGTPADVAAGERQARAIVELGGEEP